MKNIQYINAGAGSGKTTRLTEILSEKLGKREFKPSEVILTTFTELAASEFREKSRERLYKDHHADVAAELSSATIGTVHSVALRFIQKYWYLIGVSPDMKVMSDDDLQVYISESLGDYVDQEELESLRSYCTYFDLREENQLQLDFWKDHLLDIIDKVNNYDVDIERSKADSCHVVDQVYNSNTALNRELVNAFTQALASKIDGYSPSAKPKIQPILDGLKNKTVTYATIVKLYKELTKDKPYMGKGNRKALISIIGDDNFDALVANLKAYQTSSG